ARRVAANDLMPNDPGYGGPERHTQVLFSDWTPKNLSPHNEDVEVYSNCKEVELFLNGKSLGRKPINADASPRVWHVAFAPGILKAVARNDKKIVATQELFTAGKPAAIKLETRNPKLGASWDDVAIVRATIVDANGIPVPRADDLISFGIRGLGVIAATDNGDNANHESFQTAQRQAYLGECVAFVKAGDNHGTIKVSANAAGLKPSSVTLQIVPSAQH